MLVMHPYTRTSLALVFLTFLSSASLARAVTIDFETEDDFVTTLVNGQSISTAPDVQVGDTVFEFGNLVNISTRTVGSDGHEGAAIFDSTRFGPNDSGGVATPPRDPDLLVSLGNILILQNDDDSAKTTSGTHGFVFDIPNDEKSNDDRGALVFDFISPVEMVSIDLIDINGGVKLDVTMTDLFGNKRLYEVPVMWTNDIAACGFVCVGFHTLDLQTVLAQTGEPGAPGGPTPAPTDTGLFDVTQVTQLDIEFLSEPSGSNAISGGVDNIKFNAPEPSAGLLLLIGTAALARRRKRVS